MFGHRGEVDAAVRAAIPALAAIAGVTGLDVNRNGSVVLHQTAGPGVTVTVEVGATAAALATAEVDPDTRTVRVTVSERATPALVRDALLAQLGAAVESLVRTTATIRPDVLRDQEAPDRAIDPDALSAADRAHLVDLRHVATELESRNPLRRWRAGREVVPLLGRLGLLDRPTETTPGGSTSYERRLALLDEDLRATVRGINAGVDATPSATPGLRLLLTRGVLTTGVTSAATTAAMVAFGILTNNPTRISAAVVTAAGATVGLVTGSLAEQRFARQAENQASRVDSPTPTASDVRAVQDRHARELGDWVGEVRAATEAESSATAERQGHLDGLATTAPHRVARSTGTSHPRTESRRRLPTSADETRARMHAADQQSAGGPDTTADAHPDATQKVLPARSWFARLIVGPATAAGVALGVSSVLPGLTDLPGAGVAVAILGIAAGTTAVSTFSERAYARAVAERQNTRHAVLDARARAASTARTDAAVADLRREQGLLTRQEAQQRDLTAWLDRAAAAVAHDLAHPDVVHPDGPRRTETLPARPDASAIRVPPARVAEQAARVAAVLAVSATADSDLRPDGSRRAAPGRVVRTATDVLSALGARDGLAETPRLNGDGTVELRYDEDSAIRVRVETVGAGGLAADGLVARVRTDLDGTHVIELSDRLSGRAVPRAVLAALNQVVAAQLGAASTTDRLAPGAATGPIDPTSLSPSDHARIADVTHLLDLVDRAGSLSRRRLHAEYQAALRAAGLDAPVSAELDPDVLGWPRRRAVIDPVLADRIAMHDPLPSTVPSLWASQGKALVGMGLPALATGAFLVLTLPVTAAGLISAVAVPLAAGAFVGLGERVLARSSELRTDRARAVDRAATAEVRAEEASYLQTVQARLESTRARVAQRQMELTVRHAQFDLEVRRAARAAVESRRTPLGRLLHGLVRRGDPGIPDLPVLVALRAQTDQTAHPVEQDPHALRATDPHPSLFAARYAAPPIAALAGATAAAVGVGQVRPDQLADPSQWAGIDSRQYMVAAGAVSSAVALVATVPALLGQVLFSRVTLRAEIQRELALGVLAERARVATHDARLRPGQQQLAAAQTELNAARARAAAQQQRYNDLISGAVPRQGRGPIRVAIDVLGGRGRPDPAHRGATAVLDDGSDRAADLGPPDGPTALIGTPGPPPHPLVTAAVEAAQRAALGVGARVTQGVGVVELHLPGQPSVRLRFQPARLDVTLTVQTDPDGTRVVLLNENLDAGRIAREVVHGVTGLVLVSVGAQRAAPVLRAGPTRTDVSAADLTVGDRQALAALTELVRQFTTGSPTEHLALLNVLHDTLVRLGLTATTEGVTERRGLVPPTLLRDIDTLAPDTTPEGRARLETDYWSRLRRRVFVNGYYPLREPPPRPLTGPHNDGTHVPQFPPPQGSGSQPPPPGRPNPPPPRDNGQPDRSAPPRNGHPPLTSPGADDHPPSQQPGPFGPAVSPYVGDVDALYEIWRDALTALGTATDRPGQLAALQTAAQAGAALLVGGVLPTGVGRLCGLFGTTVFLALLSGQTALLDLLAGPPLGARHERFAAGCPEHTLGWERLLREYVVNRDHPAPLVGLINEVRSVLRVAGEEPLEPRAAAWVEATDVPTMRAFEQLLVARTADPGGAPYGVAVTRLNHALGFAAQAFRDYWADPARSADPTGRTALGPLALVVLARAAAVPVTIDVRIIPGWGLLPR